MPTGWFMCPYKRRPDPTQVERYCAMDDFTPEIFAAGGDWSEVEIDGNQAVVLTRANPSTLTSLGRQFRGLNITEARTAAESFPRKPRYDKATDTIIFDGPTRKTKDIEDAVRDVPELSQSNELGSIIGLWASMGFGLGWRLPWWFIEKMVSMDIGPPPSDLVGLLSLFNQIGTFPTTSIIDAFDRADENPLSGGGLWTNVIRPGHVNMKVLTNVVAATADTARSSAYRNNVSYGPATEAFVTMSTFLEETGIGNVMHRVADPGLSTVDGYASQVANITAPGTDEWYVFRIDNDAATQLGATVTQAAGVGDSIGGDSIGSSINTYRRPSGGSWGVLVERTDTTYSAAGRIGMVAYGLTFRFNDFGGGTVGPPYQPWSLRGPVLAQ